MKNIQNVVIYELFPPYLSFSESQLVLGCFLFDCAFTPDATCANKSRYSHVVGRLNILNVTASFVREIHFTTDANLRHGRGFCHCKRYR